MSPSIARGVVGCRCSHRAHTQEPSPPHAPCRLSAALAIDDTRAQPPDPHICTAHPTPHALIYTAANIPSLLLPYAGTDGHAMYPFCPDAQTADLRGLSSTSGVSINRRCSRRYSAGDTVVVVNRRGGTRQEELAASLREEGCIQHHTPVAYRGLLAYHQ